MSRSLRPRTRIPRSDIAFLFLTYDDIVHDKTKAFVERHSVYVNVKNPVKMNERYVVLNEKTEWATKSIVDATLKLLEKAYEKDHQWYVLLAHDVYPLVSIEEFKQFMKFQTKSMFHLVENRENEWKSSQWWILTKSDVEVILSRRLEYEEYLKKIPYKIKAAWDELYFLSLLKYVNPAYTYLEYKTVFIKWLQNAQQVHPVTYNKVLQHDLDEMRGSFFLRKTTSTFSISPHKNLKRLVIKIYGTLTKDYEPGDEDVVLLSMVKNDSIPDKLLKQCLYVYHTYHKPSSIYTNVLEILDLIPIYLWEEVIILSEECNRVIITPPGEKCRLPSTSISSPRHFYRMNEEQSFLYVPSKIAFLFLTIGDINQPGVWTEYFKNKDHKVSVYVHSKFPEQITTPWLKDRVITNTVPTGWGFITEAYHNLFEEAFKDEDNVKFVTISESCIPLKKFDDFYNKMMSDHVHTSYVKFMNRSKYNTEVRIKSQMGYEAKEPIIKHYARMCLSRYHVGKLLKESFDFFNKMHVGDEFFLSLLNPKENVDYMKNFEITYDNWEDTDEKVKKVKEEIYKLKESGDTSFETMDKLRIKEALRDDYGRNPKTYLTISPKELETAVQKESFFWRKFPSGNLPWISEILSLDKPKNKLQPVIKERREMETQKSKVKKSKTKKNVTTVRL